MIEQVVLYVSAAGDLELEREVLSRSLAEIPTTLGWRVVFSPAHSEAADLDLVARADVHLVLMGGDIRAPVGQEWLAARRAGRRPVLYLRQDILRTPAAREFIRYAALYAPWEAFKDAAELRRKAMSVLATHLIDGALHYAVMPDELERLQAYRSELESAPGPVDGDTRGGAGAGGVIFSPQRHTPPGGVLLGKHD